MSSPARAVRALSSKWHVLPALRAAVIYLLSAGVRIYRSDHWLQSLPNAEFAAAVGTCKGLLFALVTAILFFMSSLRAPLRRRRASAA